MKGKKKNQPACKCCRQQTMSTGMPLSSKCSSRFSCRTTTKTTEAPRKREINARAHERGVEVKELGRVRFSLALPRLSSIGDAGRRCICEYIAMIKRRRRRRKRKATDSKVRTDADIVADLGLVPLVRVRASAAVEIAHLSPGRRERQRRKRWRVRGGDGLEIRRGSPWRMGRRIS